ncbi:hypothetical protein [Burkholderia sp. BCC1988]|uniref:hypothetical protein n=1 Tax=Burkholderia sp. BCC1988 TaxID=2817443 RepID=UPI002AB22435|nr:hypothetical protein [Burkholderia sp. BCC1988]
MKAHLRLVVAAISMLTTISTLAEEDEAYLPPQSAVALLADGVPWSAVAPSGRTFKLTLNKDGTGSIHGPLLFTLSVKWVVKGDAMCISGTLMAKCLRFREVPGGIQSWEGDKPDLKLSR